MIKILFAITILLSSSLFAASVGAIDPLAMDTSVSPCEDFYQYSCGNWLKSTTIPSDKSSWYRSFSVIDESNLALLNKILSDYSQGNFTPPSNYAAKLGDFYASCMNVSTAKNINQSLQAQLNRVDQNKSAASLSAYVARMHLSGQSAFFSLSASADLKDSTLEIAEIDQGGLGLPDSTYYTDQSPRSAKIRDQYKEHIAKMFELTGFSHDESVQNSETVLAIETSLANSALPPEELQDSAKLYNPIAPSALAAMVPEFDWNLYFITLKISTPTITNVTEPKFMTEMNNILKTNSLTQIAVYLKWHIIKSVAPYSVPEIYDEWFRFYQTVLQGKVQQPARWKTCVDDISEFMGEALGQAFVQQTFTPRAKEKVLAMIENLRQAFQKDLETLPWLDQSTRKAALVKLDLITQKIGYPDSWRNYDNLKIDRVSFVQNVQAARAFEKRRELNKIGGKVDPSEWYMTPQTVNAYYDPSTNQINFPAGILQSPFFSENENDAVNYGAIGMVIGHEMTHGFDTSGSQFDGYGNVKDWWTADVKAKFKANSVCLENQYSQYEVLPGHNINGKLTVTENIADFGGVKLAFAAYKIATAGAPAVQPVAGLNSDQQFFVSTAQSWCAKRTDQSAINQLGGDPHSPAKFRIIGTMVNSPDFAQAFSCAPGTPMAPINRCEIW